MLKVFGTVLCVLAGVSVVVCYCTQEKLPIAIDCTFQFTCYGTITGHDVQLPDKCLGSTNYPVVVKVNLNEAIERFVNTIDIDTLSTITDLRITAQWKETALEMLQYTSKLRRLTLVAIGLEHISGSPFHYLNYLEDLNLSYNNLKDIQNLFVFEASPNKLQRLWLAHNAIKEIPISTFEDLSSLTELDLSFNSISDLTEEPFYNLTKLEILRLNNNRIKDLNGAVNSLQYLKHLYLRGNHLQNIDDESLKIIEHLETFDVSGNNLENMKPIIFVRHWEHFGNYSRCKIILSENHISSVPNGTSKEIVTIYEGNLGDRSTNIHTEVDLSINSIETIEYNAFQSLIRVEILDLSKNRITDFVVNSDDLAYIQNLNLSSNFISHLRFESFSQMNNLLNLDLSNNHLDFIPDMSFNGKYNLKLVNMTHNAIIRLDSIRIVMFHPEGGVLDLANNSISELQIPYGEGMRLIHLILHSNNISKSDLIDLTLLSDLKYLDMSINQICELEASSLRLPINLETLDLTHNKIHRIGPSTFHTLKNLKSLFLSYNQLINLEYGSFYALTNLKTLDLSYNGIRHLDSNLLTDLKSLRTLSVKSNDMSSIDYKGWYDHKDDLQVYIDNNKLKCQWLVQALQDYKNEISKMNPVVLVFTRDLNSVEGIPCEPDRTKPYTHIDNKETNNDKLLIISQKILEAVREENESLKKMLWYNIQKDNNQTKIWYNIPRKDQRN